MKTLAEWVHYSMLKWRMPGLAVKFDHGGTWHKVDEQPPTYTHCHRFIGDGDNLREVVGKYMDRQSPWDGRGNSSLGGLCSTCWKEEIPLLQVLESELGHYAGFWRTEQMSDKWFGSSMATSSHSALSEPYLTAAGVPTGWLLLAFVASAASLILVAVRVDCRAGGLNK